MHTKKRWSKTIKVILMMKLFTTKKVKELANKIDWRQDFCQSESGYQN
jgi:hypothetical protein